MPLTLLFLAANPTDTARLRVDQECRLIGKALRSAEYRDPFNLENHGAVHVEDLQELFLLHRPQIVHFSGHGSSGGEIVLEDKNGNSQAVPVEALSRLFAILKGNIRCVVLNACATEAQAQAIAQPIDCVIGMSQAISDDASIVFATAFYRALGFGQSVQTAFDLACNAIDLNQLEEQDIPRLIALHEDPAQIILADPQDASSSPRPPRSPRETSSLIHLTALSASRNELFLGRQAELETLQCHLTGDPRTNLVAICAAPGQGKTTLARQAAERFGPDFPGGVLAISLENPLTRPELVSQIAAFLGLDTTPNPPQLERQVLRTLERRPTTLLLLDNAETLTHALQHDDPAALDLNDLLQNQLPPAVTLLVTSRTRFTLGWAHEFTLDLRGLSPAEGAQLFQQHAPDRRAAIDPAQLEALSVKLEGHPLSLRLLGAAFNDSGLPLRAFLSRFETHLIAAKKHAKNPAQRSLIASIETSIEPLDPELKTLFYNLALFHAPFRASDAAAIFDPASDESQTGEIEIPPTSLEKGGKKTGGQSLLHNVKISALRILVPLFKGGQGGISTPPTTANGQPSESSSLTPLDKGGQGGILLSTHLHHLWQRGLLERQLHPTGPTQLELYHLLPPLRLYAEQTTPIPPEILPRFAQIYGELIYRIWDELDKGPTASLLARLSAPDLERALEHTQGLARARYNRYLGYVEFRLGHPWKGKPHLEQALAWARDHDRQLAASALNVLGLICGSTGQPQEALKYYQETLQIDKETGNRSGEATRLTNIGAVYYAIGQPQEALQYYREALPIRQEVGDRAGEASTLNNIGAVYADIGQPQEALQYYREALPIRWEVGDRAGGAVTLSNIGAAYRAIGQPQEALQYYREALPIFKEVSNRSGEAVTLNNIGMVYHAIGQPQEALQYYCEALPIRQEVGDRAGEATTLNNIGRVYDNIGQPQEALKYYRKVLPISQEVGDRGGEATTLNNMASLLVSEGQNQQALDLFWQVLNIFQEINAVASEAVILYNMAFLLGTRLNDPTQALPLLRRSIELLKTNGLPQDSAGTTLAKHEALLAELEARG